MHLTDNNISDNNGFCNTNIQHYYNTFSMIRQITIIFLKEIILFVRKQGQFDNIIKSFSYFIALELR